ncbi:hypothetical protein [Burkholderia pseudomultivorans]|uniref:Uncharacterized protein n=1 Tax=Burkholderia cenocepacia TaxID=95486 RepID=A0AAN0RXN4_9BURK|nr:hypothetical protein [Burkholderia pseudomultivorans]AIO35952.1 hypothetical protein DM39_6079 [Burkholderia cenocepacia]KVG64889.1 hypothetical protein WS80_15730 [Burkholderia pseudomultivorans]KWF04197.1 hypothetical protein WT55_25755 [Burkholderia pseudomultivorans]
MTFNTGMPFPEPPAMSLDPVCECPTETSCAAVAATDAPAPKRRTERAGRVDGRHRFRFGDAIDAMNDAPPRPVTGSIALSFAVVSRRNWPR